MANRPTATFWPITHQFLINFIELQPDGRILSFQNSFYLYKSQFLGRTNFWKNPEIRPTHSFQTANRVH